MLKRVFLWLGFLGILPLAFAQIERPVTWSFSSSPADNGHVIVQFTATIDPGWHLYSQFIEEGGPVPTSFTFENPEGYTIIGQVKESGNKHSGFDETFKMELAYFDTKATFTQEIELAGTDATVAGYLEFMVCNDEKCLPPEYVDFAIPVKAPAAQVAPQTETAPAAQPAQEQTPPPPPPTPAEQSETKPSSPISGAGSSLIPNTGGVQENPVSWTFDRREGENGHYELVFKAEIEEGWKIYAQDLDEGGPIPTEFFIEQNDAYELVGKPAEIGEIHEGLDEVFGVNVAYYEGVVEFVQQVKFAGEPVPVKGELVFMVCNDEMCLPPTYIDFNIGGKQVIQGPADDEILATLILDNLNLEQPVSECIEKQETGISFWGDFIQGFLGGLLALLTPCVFPMIPLTVSFFTKSSSDPRKGMINAFLYGLAIFGIYTIASAPFHLVEEIAGNVFNIIATDPWLNMGFFVIFVAFAISFFGYYDITLPSSLANRANSSSGMSLVGIFFMALTLCIVSFSCTGPILGSLVAVSASGSVSAWNLTAAMAGFGLALALPFGLFAAFPGWLNSLPKSGGWLTTVKVVLGFIELALAVKFFSNADLVEHWGLVKRETFFLLWIMIGIAIVLYLLGKIKFPHDSPIQKISASRWVAIAAFGAFTLYLVPGLFNNDMANRRLLSGFPPPMFYSWYEQDSECPLDLPCYKDLEEGMAAAKAQGKPVMLDFTGWACVNCRRMEENVWVDDEVFQRLSEDYVLISLYTDDRKALPEDQVGQVVEMSTGSRRKLRTVGDKWAVFQEENFHHNTQPLYALLTPEGELLNQPVAYTPDVEEYLNFLDCGLSAYEEVKTEKR